MKNKFLTLLTLSACLSACLSFAQTATINGQRANFRVLVGSAAPSSGTCDAASERGSIYLRTGDQASVPSQMYVCKQSGASTYGWGPAGWVAQASAPATCVVGDLYFDTDATAGENLKLCTDTHTWTTVSGGGGTGDAASPVTVSYSATPTFTADSNTANVFTITLTGNVTSCTLSSFTTGQVVVLKIVQDGTGGRTFACTGFSGLGSISTVASKTSIQTFVATSASAAVAVGPMVTDETNYSVSVVPTGDITMTLPSTSFTAVGEGTTQTLTDKTLTAPTVNDGTFDLDGGTLEVPNSTSLPGTCTPGQVYVDTDATSGQRFHYCDSTNTWQALGGGGSGYPAILTTSWVSGGKTVSAGATVQQAPIGRIDLGYDTSSARFYLQTAGTLRNLCVYTYDAQPGTGSMTVTTYKNGSTSSQVATVTSSGAAGRYCDTSNTISMSSGDYFYYTITNNASGTSAQILWSSVEVVP
jgi:hypothetical protein